MKIRILTCLLSLFLCCGLVGCSNSGKAVMTYGDSVITENIFRYYLAYYKGIYMDTYTDMKDTSSYYQTILPDGQSAEEYLFNMTVENVMMTLICMELFEESGLEITDGIEAEVDAYIDELVQEYAGGDKKALNAELANYGVNVNMLADIYINQDKSSFLFDYLFGENGTRPITDAEKQTYYENNYSHIYHLYINDAYYYPVTEDGYTKTDENGNLIAEPLTADMLEEKNAVIAAVDSALSAGEAFLDVYNTYSEDKYYANGYYLTQTTNFIDEVVETAFSLEIGTWQKVKSDYGTHYIYRLPLDEAPWESEANADFFEAFDTTLASELFVEYIRSFLPEVQVDREALAAYSVESSPINYRF